MNLMCKGWESMMLSAGMNVTILEPYTKSHFYDQNECIVLVHYILLRLIYFFDTFTWLYTVHFCIWWCVCASFQFYVYFLIQFYIINILHL